MLERLEPKDTREEGVIECIDEAVKYSSECAGEGGEEEEESERNIEL